MGILDNGETRPKLALTANERTGHSPFLSRVGVGLFKRPHDEGADGGAGTLGAVTQPVVKRFGEIDSGADGHDMIMSQTKNWRASGAKARLHYATIFGTTEVVP